MEISTTFTTTPKTVMESDRACHRTGYILRWVLALGIAALGVSQADLVPVLIAVASFGFSEFSVRRQLKPYLSGPRTVTVSMTDDEYRIQGPDRASSCTWTAFTRVGRVGGYWVLRVSNMAAIGLPRSALDASQTAAFEDFMRSKGLLGKGE